MYSPYFTDTLNTFLKLVSLGGSATLEDLCLISNCDIKVVRLRLDECVGNRWVTKLDKNTYKVTREGHEYITGLATSLNYVVNRYNSKQPASNQAMRVRRKKVQA